MRGLFPLSPFFPFFNDGLRRLMGLLIGWAGTPMEILHWVRMVTYPYSQKRLRRRYRIAEDTPVLSYDAELEEHIRGAAARYSRAGFETRFARTSGSTAAPKHILYTKFRMRSTRWMFIDSFVRAFRAYRVRRKSLYVFSAFEMDHSLTSMLREERRLPFYLVTLQAPYRVERHPAIQDLASRYGAVAVQLWVLVISNPGVIYCTNPSTLWLFLQEIAAKWRQSTQLIRDFQIRPEHFSAAVHNIARRLASMGSAERVACIAVSDEPLSLSDLVPAVQAYMCWTGGYVKPFLNRLQSYLPANRYQLIPMVSMSTETIETVGHYVRNNTQFLPMASGVLYEFIEEGARDCPGNLRSAEELRAMTAYTMVVSDSFGLRRYQTEDVFLCNGHFGKLPDLRFLSRRNLEYSFTGEKLSAEQLSHAFALLRDELLELRGDVFLTCVPSLPLGDLLPHYKLLIVGGCDNVTLEICDAMVRRCDMLLQEMNVEYGSKRQSGRLGKMGFARLSFDDFIGRFGTENQFKFLPLYRRTWEDLVREPAGVLCE